jgi:betaine-aldehyde dehydrogenase
MTSTLSNFVGGSPVDVAGDCADDLLDPGTGEPLAHAPRSSAADVDRAVAAAAAAAPGWAAATPAERSRALLRLGDAIERRADELAALESRNAGKPIAAVQRDELPAAVDNLRFFAGALRVLEGRAAGEYLNGHTSYVRREAIGVIGQVTPWNYPLMEAIWNIGPALAAGNTVVIKPAETTPMTTLRLAELAADVLPAGVLNVVLGAARTGEALFAHPDVDMVSFTGSVESGRRVAELAGRGLKRTHLELGGKAPVVIFDDVDLDAALDAIADAGFYNAGQDCTAATRVLAARDVQTTWSPGWPTGRGASCSGTPPTTRRRWGRSTRSASATGSSGSSSAGRAMPRW